MEKSQQEDLLDQIWNAELDCRKRFGEVESAKEELKDAKSLYDRSVIRLRQLAAEAYEGERADELDAERPLLPKEDSAGQWASEEEVAGPETETDSGESQSEYQDWRTIPTAEFLGSVKIKGLGKQKKAAVCQEFPTLQSLHEATDGPAGVSDSVFAETKTALADFLTKYDVSPSESPQPVDEEAAILERATEIRAWTVDQCRERDEETFMNGFAAFNADYQVTDCPWTPGDKQDDWLYGFLSAEKESAETVAAIDDL